MGEGTLESHGWGLLALDLDGTLLDDNLAVNPRDRAALERARAGGVEVTLLTGRMLPSVWPYLKELKITAPVVLYNGALIHDLRLGQQTVLGGCRLSWPPGSSAWPATIPLAPSSISARSSSSPRRPLPSAPFWTASV